MNEQPHPIVGQFGVLIFSLLVAYFAFTNKNKKIAFSDKYDIGYIYDTPAVVEYIEKPTRKRVNNQSNKVKVQKQQQTEEKPSIDQQLFDDCVLSLVSLGTKKGEAKNITKNVFDKHNPQTIEDFIKFVYIT